MIQITGDLFKQSADAIAITTNGHVKNNGRCVVGKGCAKMAEQRWPEFSLELGKNIKNLGNIPSIILEKNNSRPWTVMSFPVKPAWFTVNNTSSNIVSHMKNKVQPGTRFYGWASKAEEDIILDSARKLVSLVDTLGYDKVVIPRPGCGAGELDWDTIGPKLSRILDDRFFSITFR